MEGDELRARGLSLRHEAYIYKGNTRLDARNDHRLSCALFFMSIETRIKYKVIRAAQKTKHCRKMREDNMFHVSVVKKKKE